MTIAEIIGDMDTKVSYVITVYNTRGRQLAQSFVDTYAEAIMIEKSYRAMSRKYRVRFEMLPR